MGIRGAWHAGLFFFLLSCTAGTAAAPGGACEHDQRTFRCVQYLKNYDADTITVKIPGVHPLLGDKISVRVAGIDSAEMKAKDGCEYKSARTARKLVEAQLKNAKNIELRNVDRDKYFRILADVYVDGVSIKDTLIKNNLAVAYDGKTKAQVNWCAANPAASPRLPAGKRSR